MASMSAQHFGIDYALPISKETSTVLKRFVTSYAQGKTISRGGQIRCHHHSSYQLTRKQYRLYKP